MDAPKLSKLCELHCHLDGSLRPSTFLELYNTLKRSEAEKVDIGGAGGDDEEQKEAKEAADHTTPLHGDLKFASVEDVVSQLSAQEVPCC